MIEMMLGAMVMALLVKAIPAAIVDTVTTLRAATAGEWGLLDKERDRKHQRAASRREAVSKAWQATRARRNKKAGGDGNCRPGAKAYFGDVYHGFWEDALEKRTVRRAGRPPNRYDRAVEAKVGRQRAKTGYLGRAGRLLWEPVGEPRQPSDVVPPQTARRDDGGPAGTGAATPEPVDPWPFDGDDPTVEIPADGPRTACEHCGSSLVRDGDGWTHPAGAICPTTNRQEDPVTERLVDHVPATPASSPADRTEATDAVEAATHRLFERPTTGTYPNGGTAMTDNTDLLDYTTAVAEHEQVLAKLREQRAEATAFKQHITGATTAVEHMDGNRGVLATGLSAIAEGMEGSRFGADATSGSAEAAGALSAGSIAAVQEHIEAANDTNDRWITELDASIEGVQASLQHLKSTYGEAAATVQETGVDARALAEH